MTVNQLHRHSPHRPARKRYGRHCHTYSYAAGGFQHRRTALSARCPRATLDASTGTVWYADRGQVRTRSQLGTTNSAGTLTSTSATVIVSPSSSAPSSFSAQTPPASASTSAAYNYTFVANVASRTHLQRGSGSFAAGPTLNPATGALSGTPTSGGITCLYSTSNEWSRLRYKFAREHTRQPSSRNILGTSTACAGEWRNGNYALPIPSKRFSRAHLQRGKRFVSDRL